MRGQGDVKAVRRANHKMEPDQMPFPTPDQMPDREAKDDQHHIKRKKIGGKRDQKIVLRHHHMPTLSACLELFHPPAEQPGPQNMRRLMSEYVDPHRFG